MPKIVNAADIHVLDRIHPIDMAYADAAREFTHAGIHISAFYVPHAGWPTRVTDVQNIAFRVSFESGIGIAHLGDADPNHLHFDKDQKLWSARETWLAMPPYWFFNSSYGNGVLENNIQPQRSIGIHVPASFSDASNIPPEFREFELFIVPGERLQLEHDDLSEIRGHPD